MKPETLTALQGSIAKWQAIVDGTGVDKGADNCPLCQRFDDEEEYIDDEGRSRTRFCVRGSEHCPVMMKSGRDDCSGTPYKRYRFAESARAKQAAAQAELDFLKSLLP